MAEMYGHGQDAVAGKSLIDYQREAAQVAKAEQPTLLEALYDNQTTTTESLRAAIVLVGKLRIKLKGLEAPSLGGSPPEAPICSPAEADKSLTKAINRAATHVDDSARLHKTLEELLRLL